MNFRALTENEIEVRVGTCNGKGVSLLLYKDARTDANVLDETVGEENWQNKFYECKGNLFCSVGILTVQEVFAGSNIQNWIWKDDCGSESNMEAQKGEASDAFKRACFKWGIGRELYTAPFIWVPADKCNIKQGKNGKPSCYDKFSVEKIETENGRIQKIAIWNGTTNQRVFVMKGA